MDHMRLADLNKRNARQLRRSNPEMADASAGLAKWHEAEAAKQYAEEAAASALTYEGPVYEEDIS